MGRDYYIYNPKTGDLLSDTRYAGMPFTFEENLKYGKECAIEWDYTRGPLNKIKEWSVDKDSELYKKVFNVSSWYFNDAQSAIYYRKEEILEMQKTMSCNETLLEELMICYDLDELIVQINY